MKLLKVLLKLKGLRGEGIKGFYKMSGNAMLCHVSGCFSPFLSLPHFVHSNSVFVFNNLR